MTDPLPSTARRRTRIPMMGAIQATSCSTDEGMLPPLKTAPVTPVLSDAALQWIDPRTLVFGKRRLAKENDRQHRQLMASISEFGFVTALVIKGKEVIVGAARLRAAIELGVIRVPAVQADHLTPTQVRKFRIADNRLAELREWDPAALKAEFDEIVLLDPDLNFEAMGFEIPELDVVLHGTDNPTDPADAIVSVPDKSHSRDGLIWEGDGHAILCGDARSSADWAAVLDGATPAVVIADPPWNVPVKSHMGGKGAIKHREFVMASGEMTDDEFLAFQTDWLTRATEHTPPGGLIYVASDWRALYVTSTAARACNLEQINLCVWQKTPALGSMYRSAHELFLQLRKRGAGHRNNIRLGAYGRFRSNCWNYPSASSFGVGREGLAIHPTAKPIALLSDIILDCTKRGDVVVDPFSGSGSTLIAAQRTGRIARVIERDPLYVDAAVRRYEQIFGRALRLRGTGQTLADLAKQEGQGAANHGAIDGAAVRSRRKRKR